MSQGSLFDIVFVDDDGIPNDVKLLFERFALEVSARGFKTLFV
jgi:hypothetical protein